MGIFNTYTRRCLQKNRVRTIVTIIGIILSMTMLTAVIEGANSGMQYLARAEIVRSGSCHGIFYEVPGSRVGEIAENPDIADTLVWSRVGWAEIDNNSGSSPYLLLADMGHENKSLAPVHLLRGGCRRRRGRFCSLPTLCATGRPLRWAPP